MKRNNTFIMPEGCCCSYTCWDCKHIDKNEYQEDVLTLGYCSGYWCDIVKSYVKSDSSVSGCTSFEKK
ncbi:MAG: hypothetical protein K2K70_09570 [Lachnospiraceae bacterium]|nr:hypothetical protein [Lachnospiraceae bacterium]